ncbi:hypothetical protein niasHS_002662 [Heterodera schachtii]|uniref:C2H2-type domain-containing protein n=1 Tax=Heterodera schachtii TaxID=97005 RepID=A0ABD2K237_HETSC
MTSPIAYDQLREMTRNFLSKGVSAVETNAIFQGKFGTENSPTLCTIYKWRREHRGGMREANDQNLEENEKEKEKAADDGGEKGAKPYKKDCDKYCVPCNRELSSRHYYELHMLKIHNIFVGDSKALYELLESFGPKREKKIIYRCDECFGGELDYELLEDLRRHRLLEHGKKMREKFDSPAQAKHFEPPPPQNVPLCPSSIFPSSPRRSTPKIRRCRSTVPFAFSPSNKKDDDRSTDESTKTLRRSARVPKPSPALIQSLLDAKEMAKEFANYGENRHGESEDNEAEPIVTIMKDGRIEVEETERREKPKTKRNAGGGAKKRTMSPDAMDAADSMLKLAFTEQQKKQQQNAEMDKGNAEMDKGRDESQQRELAEEAKADKRRKSFSIARPNRHDDCTWFGHSIAASLRQMPIHTKELAKTRIQQVIYECTSPIIQNDKDKEKAQRNGTIKSDGTDNGKGRTSII